MAQISHHIVAFLAMNDVWTNLRMMPENVIAYNGIAVW